MSLIGFCQLLPTLQIVAGRPNPEARRSRKGRNPRLRIYYEGVLARLIAARIECGLTQRDVSLRLGMAHSFMNNCESGDRAIDVVELWALANLYEKPISHLAPDK